MMDNKQKFEFIRNLYLTLTVSVRLCKQACKNKVVLNT